MLKTKRLCRRFCAGGPRKNVCMQTREIRGLNGITEVQGFLRESLVFWTRVPPSSFIKASNMERDAFMKKAVIFYFSGTGNTWWVSEKLGRYLSEKGFSVAVYSIEKISATDADKAVRECELVGIGYPTYGSDLPHNMKIFIHSLTPVREKTAFVFCTQWLWSGDGARIGGSMLKRKGFGVKWAEHFLMPNNVCVAATPFLPYTNDRKAIDRRLAGTEKQVLIFAERIAKGRPFLRGYNIFAKLAGGVQRIPFIHSFHRLRDDIKVDDQKCIRCGACVRLCPSQNLFWEAESVKTKGVCILCLRCYNFCPKSAVTYMKKAHNQKRGETYKGPVEHFNAEILKH
jgi:flavodoxin/ferredoxin